MTKPLYFIIVKVTVLVSQEQLQLAAHVPAPGPDWGHPGLSLQPGLCHPDLALPLLPPAAGQLQQRVQLPAGQTGLPSQSQPRQAVQTL